MPFCKWGLQIPRLNILQAGFSDYYIVGVRVSWDFTPLYTTFQTKEITQKNILLLESSKKEFILQNKIALINRINEAKIALNNYEKSDEIIKLQENILQISKVQLSNGVLSSSDFSAVLNDLYLAKEQKNVEEINFLLKIVAIKQQLNEFLP